MADVLSKHFSYSLPSKSESHLQESKMFFDSNDTASHSQNWGRCVRHCCLLFSLEGCSHLWLANVGKTVVQGVK